MNPNTTTIQTGKRIVPVLFVLFALLTGFAQSLQLASVADPAAGPAPGGGGNSGDVILSPDGRYVLFASSAENLALASTNSSMHSRVPALLNVYLRDRSNGITALISVNVAGLAGGTDHSVPMGISTNGQYVLFESSATNLVNGDTNSVSDVFVRDLAAGKTMLVSANINGLAANGASGSSVISSDGRYVAFSSKASDLVHGDTNGFSDVFVRDLQASVTTLASVEMTSPATIAGNCDAPVLTPDGKFVAFSRRATLEMSRTVTIDGTNMVIRSSKSIADVFVRDLVHGMTTWASAGAQAVLRAQTNVVSFNHAISENGGFVVYEASADSTSPAVLLRHHVPTGNTLLLHTNAGSAAIATGTLDMTPDARRVAFVANAYDASGITTCVVVWDSQTGAVTLASGNMTGPIPELTDATAPMLDHTGRYVVFLSNGAGLVTNQIAPGYHVYVRDLQAGRTVLVDIDSEGFGSGVDTACWPSMSADGRFVAFTATDGTLVPNDHNLCYDVFVRDLEAGTTELVSANAPCLPSLTPNAPSTLAPGAVSADGRFMVFRSLASDLASNDQNGCLDVFLRDLNVGTNLVISANTNGLACNANSTDPAISANGRYVAFVSAASDLMPGISNSVLNVFVRDRDTGSTVLASVNTAGTGGGDFDSTSPMISDEGRFVVFASTAGNLVLGYPHTGNMRLFQRDLQSATTYALTPHRVFSVSMTPLGHYVAYSANSSSYGSTADRLHVWDSLAAKRIYTNISTSIFSFGRVAISPDGQTIVYATNTSLSIYYHLHALRWSSKTNWLIAPLALASQPGLRFSADSRFLTYSASEKTLSSPNGNQVYVHDFQTGTNLLVSRGYLSGTNASGNSDSPDISADGRFVAYRSTASDLVPADDNNVADIFLYDRVNGSTTLLTANRTGNRSANNRSMNPVFSGDGKFVFFESWASDLLPNQSDFNGYGDIFAYEIHSSSDIPVFRAAMVPSTEGLWITWPTLPGKSYRVQFKHNLNDPEWQDAPDAATIVENQAWFKDTGSATQRFFRVMGF